MPIQFECKAKPQLGRVSEENPKPSPTDLLLARWRDPTWPQSEIVVK